MSVSKQQGITQGLRICSASEMRELDDIAEREYLIDPSLLMENAGRAAAQITLERYPHAGRTTEVLIFAGKGNNAGDAFVVARRLMCLERRVRVFHLDSADNYKGPVKKNFEILKKMKAKLIQLDTISDLDEFLKASGGPFTIVDGILGTGLKGNLAGLIFDVVEKINELNAAEVISLDVPTGVSGDTGSVNGTAIQATFTISFGFPKLGHFLPPGAAKRGELINVDVSLPPRFRREGKVFLLMKGPMSDLIQTRDRYGHKNSFGHTLLIGGSTGRLGAIIMAARACHKMGTGLVTAATWDENLDALMMKLPNETMSVPIKTSGPEFEAYRKSLAQYSSIVVGCGLGLRPEGLDLMKELLATYRGPLVIDADALNLISDSRLHEYLVNRRAPTVLTPHVGEMARLLQCSKEEVTADPVRAVRRAVELTHAVVLLKGAATLIGSPDDTLYLNHYPNDGMATAGSGDVLAGMIGGLIGQKMNPYYGSLLGVYLHSLAGDFAAQEFGHRSMTAQNIIEKISHAFKDLKKVTDEGSGTLAAPLEARTPLL